MEPNITPTPGNTPAGQGQSTFIQPTENPTIDNIFQELESELNVENGASNLHQISQKKETIEHVNLVTGILSKVAIFIFIVALVDTTIRGLETSEIVSSIPLCGYYSIGTTEYDNTDCKTYAEIKSKIASDTLSLEKSLAANLSLLVPKKLLTQNILNMPEIQFIEQKTSNTRVPIPEALDKFNTIASTTTQLKGKDIECGTFEINEKGEMTVRCDFFGYGINTSSLRSDSSRATAIAFLEKISEPSSGFTLIDTPKTMNIEKYTSTEIGVKSLFTTQTSLTLKLRYNSPNKI